MPEAPETTMRSAADKRAQVAELLRARAARGGIEAEVSAGQRALWLLQRLVPDNVAYNLMASAHVRSPLDVSALRGAFQSLAARHESLRTTFPEREGKPVRQIRSTVVIPFEEIDGSSLTEGELRRLMEREADRPFLPATGPLLKVTLIHRAPRDPVLLMAAHHLILDFWSIDLLLEELRLLYAQELGFAVEVPPVRSDYGDFVRWQREFLEGAECRGMLDDWAGEIADCPQVHDIPTDKARPRVQTYQGALHEFALDASFTARLRDLAKSEGVTLYTLLLAAFEILLYRLSGQARFLLGTPVGGRTRAEFETTIGDFANPICLRADLSGNSTVREVLEQGKRAVLEGLAHQQVPFSLLVERHQQRRDPSRSPLFQIAYVWNRARYLEGREGGDAARALVLEPFVHCQRGAPFDLTLSIVDRGEFLAAAFQYNTDLFFPTTIADWEERLRMLLAGILSDPSARVSELSLLSEGERRFFLADWNRTEAEYPKDRCVHDLIEDQVLASPDACALEWEAGTLSYAELNRRANRLAWRLKAEGIGPERIVGICLSRSPEMLIGILAVLKAGGAYLPLDPDYPEERLALMLEDARAEVVLTAERHRSKLPAAGRAILCLDDSALLETGTDSNPPREAAPENLVYVIYTSGSTGRPKGVMITHRNLMNYLSWCRTAYPLEVGSGAPLHSPIRYDLTVTTLFAPLMAGGTVVLVPERRGVDDLARLLAEDRDFSFVKVTPAHLKALGAILPKAEASNQTRCLVVGGEALTAEALSYWRQHAPETLIVNEYGPTEATVGCCVYALRAGAEIAGPVPIGRPIANTRLYVLDPHGQPVPPGVPGELYIGGDSVARGYLNRPDLTDERFVPDPFGADPSARLYRTGDLVKFRADGELEYLGRSDHQVKVAGQRIELGELETLLSGHPEVHDALVAAVETAPSDRRLVAYVIPRDERDGPSPAELRAFLRQKLPEAMLPAFFVTLAEFPLAANGKVDRKALPIPDRARGETESVYVAPRNDSERHLVEIWSRVLGIEPIGVQDNFFDLGGASIQSLAVASQASEAGIPLTAEMIFQYPTIAELAEVAVQSCEAGDQSPTPGGWSHGVEALASYAQPLQGEESPTPGDRVHSGRTVIESLGVYLPERVISTGELLAGCRNPLDFPLERMTGIRSRRVVSEGEYSIDLAEKAARDCLLRSRRSPGEIDLLICCNISRQDGPGRFSFEPSTAIQLKKRLGLPHALAFDISNACAGMFTGILISDWYLATGETRSALVVSGEYISHLAKTAQKEISGFLDPRLACLTVGDAGAAVILERSAREDIGFADLDLYTLGKYSDLCVAKATQEAHGGAIMYTDSIRQTAVALKLSVAHSANVLRRSGWSAEEIGHVIMHQTSETALRDAMREINALYGARICHAENTVINLAERGNTASTSHFVALADRMRRGLARDGDRVVFGITGSGQTIGSSLYVLDDLPTRFQEMGKGEAQSAKSAVEIPETGTTSVFSTHRERSAEILSFGLAAEFTTSPGDAVALAVEAAEAALSGSGSDRNRVDLVIHSGVYRNDFLCEPAIASIVAGRLGINHEEGLSQGRSTFAFDLLCGGLGFLSACRAGAQAIDSGKGTQVLVTTSEIENNAGVFPNRARGVAETGSAVVLGPARDGTSGFRAFAFRDFPEYADLLVAHTELEAGKTFLGFRQSPDFAIRVRELIPGVVKDLLEHEGIALSAVRLIIPPLVSEGFVAELAADLRVERDRMVGQPIPGGDLFTSSIPRGLEEARRRGLAVRGNIGLFIAAGAGIQIGCALYAF